MLSKEIAEFIREMKELNAIGCILVVESSLKTLVANLEQATMLVSKAPQPDRVTYYVCKKDLDLRNIKTPAILIVTEEDYSAYHDFEEKIRDKAGYFINVV